jgi:hypothetical protein
VSLVHKVRKVSQDQLVLLVLQVTSVVLRSITFSTTVLLTAILVLVS